MTDELCTTSTATPTPTPLSTTHTHSHATHRIHSVLPTARRLLLVPYPSFSTHHTFSSYSRLYLHFTALVGHYLYLTFVSPVTLHSSFWCTTFSTITHIHYHAVLFKLLFSGYLLSNLSWAVHIPSTSNSRCLTPLLFRLNFSRRLDRASYGNI